MNRILKIAELISIDIRSRASADIIRSAIDGIKGDIIRVRQGNKGIGGEILSVSQENIVR